MYALLLSCKARCAHPCQSVRYCTEMTAIIHLLLFAAC